VIKATEVAYGEEGFEDQLINREKEVQRQWEDCKIHKAKYKRYKEIETNSRVPEYLRKENLGEGKRGKEMRVLFKLRCGNLEEDNKYWVEERIRKSIFCGKGKII